MAYDSVIVGAAALQCPHMGLGNGVVNRKGGWWWWTCYGIVGSTTSAQQQGGKAAAGMSRSIVGVALLWWCWQGCGGRRWWGDGRVEVGVQRRFGGGVIWRGYCCVGEAGGKLVAERINMLLVGMCGKVQGGKGHDHCH